MHLRTHDEHDGVMLRTVELRPSGEEPTSAEEVYNDRLSDVHPTEVKKPWWLHLGGAVHCAQCLRRARMAVIVGPAQRRLTPAVDEGIYAME